MQFYENCRVFLEEQLRNDPTNHDLLKIYDNLIDRYTEAKKKQFKAEYKKTACCGEQDEQ